MQGHPVSPHPGQMAGGPRQRLPRGGRLATAGLLMGLFVLAAVPGCSSSSTPPTTSTTTSTSTSAPAPVTFQQGSSAEVTDCESDANTLELALSAYLAQKGSYPSPPAPWSAATYATNFQPLTTAAGGEGPYLPTPPATKFYVIEYDSSGHLWIAPPGAYSPTYNPGQSFDTNPNVCLAAVR